MEIGEHSVLVKHVRKRVIVDNETKIYRWVRMITMSQSECDGEIPITMLVKTFEYIEIYSSTLMHIINTLKTPN
jgi:hypothetical protein